jgi:hypothetical protein
MDEAPNFEGGVESADPASGGEVTETTQQVEDSTPEPRQYVEVDDPDQRYVPVTVDGQDIEVPFSELKRGYSRTEDYTRKTQEVARQREQADYGLRLQQALESNPALTLQILSQQYGMDYTQPQAPMPDAEPEYADPLERALVEERQAREALEQRFMAREADQQLEVAVSDLRGRYNVTDEDLREVIGAAYQMQVGVEALPMIYESLAFQRLNARVQQMRIQQQNEQQRVAAKQQASQLIANGSGATSNGLTNVIDSNRNMTIREAAMLAMEQAGL